MILIILMKTRGLLLINTEKSFPKANSTLVFASVSVAGNFALRKLMTYQGVRSTSQNLISSAHLFLLLQSGYSRNIFFTRPTSPLSNRTLIPYRCAGEFVKISFTVPSVSFPVRWSIFNTIDTRNPDFISDRLIPSIHYSPMKYSDIFS